MRIIDYTVDDFALGPFVVAIILMPPFHPPGGPSRKHSEGIPGEKLMKTLAKQSLEIRRRPANHPHPEEASALTTFKDSRAKSCLNVGYCGQLFLGCVHTLPTDLHMFSSYLSLEQSPPPSMSNVFLFDLGFSPWCFPPFPRLLLCIATVSHLKFLFCYFSSTQICYNMASTQTLRRSAKLDVRP